MATEPEIKDVDVKEIKRKIKGTSQKWCKKCNKAVQPVAKKNRGIETVLVSSHVVPKSHQYCPYCNRKLSRGYDNVMCAIFVCIIIPAAFITIVLPVIS